MSKFYMIPDDILADKEIGLAAKMLYVLISDRTWLSVKKSDFKDEQGYYCYYSIGSICEKLNISKGTAIKAKKELVDRGYIKVKKQQKGPDRIYIDRSISYAESESGDDTNKAEKNTNMSFEKLIYEARLESGEIPEGTTYEDWLKDYDSE